MKIPVKISFLLSLCLLALSASARLDPTVWADIPDVAPLRVGDTYYMSSTTMHMNPGIPIMASKDLVDWKIVGSCYDTIEDRAADNLADGQDDYGLGTWASSIRYDEKDGCFYVSSFNRKANHTYLFRAKDPAGPWERFVYDELIYDHSLWIEDGKFYFIASAGNKKAYLHRVKDDLSAIEPGKKLICADVTDGLVDAWGEGSQVLKKDGWYYLVNICWPKGGCRTVNVHRARTLEGPFEEHHVAFQQEGIAQGSFIEKPDGTWVAVLFGDRGGVGRIPYILPVEWRDGWPTVKAGNVYKGDFTKAPSCVSDDDFSGDKLKLEWQWNHNPDNAHWKLADGRLEITTSRVDGDLLSVRNQLTQRTFGPTSSASVTVDASRLKVGDRAGISLFQRNWGAIAVERTEKGLDVVVMTPKGVARRACDASVSRVHLRASCDFTPRENQTYTGIPQHVDKGSFAYSRDGKKWEPLGGEMDLPYSIPHFMGYRFGLFAWSTKEPGGTAAFDDYRVAVDLAADDVPPDGTNPIVKTRFTPDPAPVADGEWLYLFMGHDDVMAGDTFRMYDWSVARTKDLVHWEDFGTVMSVKETFPWAKEDRAWASQAIKRNGKWYWYVAVSPKDENTDTIAVAVADDPRGPWTDALGRGLAYGWAFIDPSVFVDDDGTAWLFWGNCGGDPGCWYAPLKENMVELADAARPVPGLMDEAAFGKPFKKPCGAGGWKEICTNFEEAPWIYKVGDTYYLEYAAGGVPEHWAYSTAKSIHGPWTYRGKIMDYPGGAHGGSVLFKGRWYMAYMDTSLEGGAGLRRSTGLVPYDRNPDGSIPFLEPSKEGVSKERISE